MWLRAGTVLGRLDAFDSVQKKAARFANHMNDSDWETLAQRKKVASSSKHTPEIGHGNV